MEAAVSPVASNSSYTPVEALGDEEPNGPMAPPPRVLDTLMRQNLRLLHFAQEALLLLLLGVASNMIAFGIDKSIALIWIGRAQAAQQASSIVLSYLTWTGSALVLCGLSASCVHYISPSASGSGIPQVS